MTASARSAGRVDGVTWAVLVLQLCCNVPIYMGYGKYLQLNPFFVSSYSKNHHRLFVSLHSRLRPHPRPSQLNKRARPAHEHGDKEYRAYAGVVVVLGDDSEGLDGWDDGVLGALCGGECGALDGEVVAGGVEGRPVVEMNEVFGLDDLLMTHGPSEDIRMIGIHVDRIPVILHTYTPNPSI